MDTLSWRKCLRRRTVAFLKTLRRAGRAFGARDQKLFPVLLVAEQVKHAPEEAPVSLGSTWNVLEDQSASEFNGGAARGSRAERGEETSRRGIPL